MHCSEMRVSDHSFWRGRTVENIQLGMIRHSKAFAPARERLQELPACPSVHSFHIVQSHASPAIRASPHPSPTTPPPPPIRPQRSIASPFGSPHPPYTTPPPPSLHSHSTTTFHPTPYH
jgi:hypothetical protein